MSGLEVSCVVGCIIATFNSGMDVFRRMKTKGRSKKQARNEILSTTENKLQDSLVQRPREIQAKYSHSVTKFGYRFEIGDTIAQTSLAHTLLVLNTGLINIINNALSNDSKARESSRRSLLSLSEVAAGDAIQALSQLDVRLSSSRVATPSKLYLPSPISMTAHTSRKSAEHKARQRVAGKAAKKVVDISSERPVRPAPSPLLVRGGWIRPRSERDGSVVSSASTSRSNLAKPTHQRSKSSPAAEQSSSSRSSPLPGKDCSDFQRLSQLGTARSDHDRQKRTSSQTQKSSDTRPAREMSMLIVPAGFFEASLPAFTEQQAAHSTPPPIPPKIPLHSRPSTAVASAPATRIRPPSVATFMTTSTKIGEIPDRKLPEGVGRLGQRNAHGPLPYIIPPPLNPADFERRKDKGRGLRFWRRTDKEIDAAASGKGAIT